jgi:hypothetical protein
MHQKFGNQNVLNLAVAPCSAIVHENVTDFDFPQNCGFVKLNLSSYTACVHRKFMAIAIVYHLSITLKGYVAIKA